MLMLPQLNKMLYIFSVLISRQGTAVISAFPAFIIHPWKKPQGHCVAQKN